MIYTKGPWQVSGVRSQSPSYKGHLVGPDGDGVVCVPYWDEAHHECLGNARLISAAPDGYLLAKYIRHCIDQNPYTEELHQMAFALISKVEGYSND